MTIITLGVLPEPGLPDLAGLDAARLTVSDAQALGQLAPSLQLAARLDGWRHLQPYSAYIQPSVVFIFRRCLADDLAKAQLYRCSGFSLMRLQIVQQIQHLGR